MTCIARRLAILAVGFMISVAVIDSAQAQGQQSIYAPRGIAIQGYDPIAYFEDGGAVMGNASFAHTWKGARWHFKTASNRDRFAADPERYAPQYGGWCAYCLSQGKMSPSDPKLSGVLGDKLYLNSTEAASKFFWNGPAQLIQLANQQWAQLPAATASVASPSAQPTSPAGALHVEGWVYINGTGVPKDPAKGVTLLRQAAEQGYAPSQDNLGWFYQDGLHGLPKSDTDALKWATAAYDNKVMNAGNTLGRAYRDGKGVQKDPARAAQYFEACANGGGTHACARNLGLLYRDGTGVPRDKDKAVEWLRKAAAKGNKAAEQDLAKLN